MDYMEYSLVCINIYKSVGLVVQQKTFFCKKLSYAFGQDMSDIILFICFGTTSTTAPR